MIRRAPIAATALLALALGGCAGSTASFPSLAPRPEEQPAAQAGPAAAATLDPAITARAATLVADARGGAAAFDTAVSGACAALTRGAGAAEGSEPWVAAQQALSAIDAARNPTATAHDDLDALVLEQARLAQDAPTPVDLTALTDAAQQIGALDAAQSARLVDLREKGCGP